MTTSPGSGRRHTDSDIRKTGQDACSTRGGAPLTHIDLFSGLGGFSLACHWNGIQTEVFCEKDERCRGFLERTYPGVPVLPDIREFDGTLWRGRFLLTAGVPCQPASRAGKQRGKDDDRWLWPEALRVVSEARPDWVLFENPDGIGDVGLDGILADLEALRYEVAPPIIIPACSVNAPQLRARYWIVAHASTQRSGFKRKSHGQAEQRRAQVDNGLQGDMADSPQDDDRRSNPGESERQVPQPGSGDGSIGGMAGTEGLRHEERRGPGGVATSEDGGITWATLTEGAESVLAYSQESGRRQGRENPGRSCEGEGETWERLRSTNGTRSQWDAFVWVPCADGKLRRAPCDSFGLVDGLHRSVLAALGNSIVPQVAAEVIGAIVIASNLGNEQTKEE